MSDTKASYDKVGHLRFLSGCTLFLGLLTFSYFLNELLKESPPFPLWMNTMLVMFGLVISGIGSYMILRAKQLVAEIES